MNLLFSFPSLLTEAVESYIDELKKLAKGSGSDVDLDGDKDDAAGVAGGSDEDKMDEDGEPEFPPVYESGEDFDKAGDAKQQAADYKATGDWEKALEKYTEAVLAAPPSALLYANRATALLKLGRNRAAERDCNLALKENPDSAKALRVRGKVRKALGMFELALKVSGGSLTCCINCFLRAGYCSYATTSD